MTKAYSFEKISAICGIVGCLCMLACVWITMVPYVGMYNEAYSTANHFISELGDRRYSELQVVFNFGLMGSSSLLVVFGLGFAQFFSGWKRIVNSLLGLVTGVSCFLVGFFPEDQLRPHLLVAMIFFHSALVLVFLNTAFTLFAKQPVLPKWTAALGFLTALAFAAFVISPSDLLRTWIASPKTFIRPQVWIQPILEWACFYSILLWILTVAVLILLGKIKGSKG
jgi:hypothetical membrane protein